MHADVRLMMGSCSLGAVVVAASERGIVAISLGDEPEPLVSELMQRFPSARRVAEPTLVDEVVRFIETPRHKLALPLDVRATPFQERVYSLLRDIPVGQRITYAELARRIGDPLATRAVAGACAKNLIAVAIPCHRVVRSDGSLSGYRWGTFRKRALLEREAADRANDAKNDRPFVDPARLHSSLGWTP